MSSSHQSAVPESHNSCASHSRCRGRWSTANIAALVVSFVLFWPVGLLVLFWILKGRNVKDLPGAIRDKWQATIGQRGHHRHGTGNSVFNEFQQAQYDRIKEIKDEIKERSNRFADFRADARKRADQEEFNQFMAGSPSTES